jgi:hypothetical protein
MERDDIHLARYAVWRSGTPEKCPFIRGKGWMGAAPQQLLLSESGAVVRLNAHTGVHREPTDVAINEES